MSAIYARQVKEHEEARLRGESPAPIEEAESPSFASLAKFYLEENEWKAASSRARHVSIIQKHLLPFLGELPASSLKAITGRRYQRRRTEHKASPATVNREWTVVRAVLNFAARHEIIAANPIKPHSLPPLPVPPARPDFFEPDEWRCFLRAFDDKKAWKRFARARAKREGLRIVGARLPDSPATREEHRRFAETRPFIEALMYTAARVGELAALRWKDVDTERHLVTLYQQKSRRPKTLPMARRLLEIVGERPRGTPEAHVFTRASGAAFYPLEIGRAFALALDLAGIRGKHLTPHQIRDTVASWLVIAGFDERTHVAEILGHSRRSVTSRYAHLTNRSLEPAIATLERTAQMGFTPAHSMAWAGRFR